MICSDGSISQILRAKLKVGDPQKCFQGNEHDTTKNFSSTILVLNCLFFSLKSKKNDEVRFEDFFSSPDNFEMELVMQRKIETKEKSIQKFKTCFFFVSAADRRLTRTETIDWVLAVLGGPTNPIRRPVPFPGLRVSAEKCLFSIKK